MFRKLKHFNKKELSLLLKFPIPNKQKQPLQVFYEKSVLRNIATLVILAKETLAQVFSCEFCEISKNAFFTEQLWPLLLNKILKFTFTFEIPFTVFEKGLNKQLSYQKEVNQIYDSYFSHLTT